MITTLIINEEQEEIDQRKSTGYEDQYAKDYIMKIDGYEDLVDQIYCLSPTNHKVLLVKEHIIYIIRLSEPIEGELLDKIVKRLFVQDNE